MSVTTCPSCNASVPPGAVFCDNCGYDLRSADAQPQVPVQETYQVSPPEGDINCPSCGHSNIAGSAFCENCGSQLTVQPSPPPVQPPPTSVEPPLPQTPVVPPPAPVQPAALPASPPSTPTPVATPPPESPPEPPPEPSTAPEPPPSLISGYFVIPGSNATLQIPAEKQTIIIGREDPVSGIFPDIDLDQHSGQDLGVGRRHAQMTLQAGQLLIEDLDSVNGTVVNKQKIPPRTPQPVKDGDEIRLGKLVLIYHSG